MSDSTNIEWCDSTFNPWIGCTKVGPGCDNCYAERSFDIQRKVVSWGAGNPRKRTSEANWKLPIKWNKADFMECIGCGARGSNAELSAVRCSTGGDYIHLARPARRRVFCASLADWLDNEVPIEWLVDLLDLIRRTPNLDWLLLTKRVGNWRKQVGAALNAANDVSLREWLALWLSGDAPANVWVGATIVNQAEADRDIPKLLDIPARVRFLSMEPLLSAVDLRAYLCDFDLGRGSGGWGNLHWVIVGGESGHKARPMSPHWAQAIVGQCRAAGVAVLVKQLSSGGSKPIKHMPDFPEGLRFREFPNV